MRTGDKGRRPDGYLTCVRVSAVRAVCVRQFEDWIGSSHMIDSFDHSNFRNLNLTVADFLILAVVDRRDLAKLAWRHHSMTFCNSVSARKTITSERQ